MSLLIAAPDTLAGAAADVASIGSSLRAAHAAAAGSTTGLVAAAEDEVSRAIAGLFSAHGRIARGRRRDGWGADDPGEQCAGGLGLGAGIGSRTRRQRLRELRVKGRRLGTESVEPLTLGARVARWRKTNQCLASQGRQGSERGQDFAATRPAENREETKNGNCLDYHRPGKSGLQLGGHSQAAWQGQGPDHQAWRRSRGRLRPHP